MDDGGNTICRRNLLGMCEGTHVAMPPKMVKLGKKTNIKEIIWGFDLISTTVRPWGPLKFTEL